MNEFELFVAIAKRYEALCTKMNMGHSERITTLMDLENVHDNCPLKLQEFLDAPDSDFAHDMFGIKSNIDRRSGTLRDGFLPRFAN